MSDVLFTPPDSWVGDVIPFRHQGRYWLFYLREIRTFPKPGTGWALVSTEDFVTFVDHGIALAAGEPDQQDFNAYTGSIVQDGEALHLFYTGQNPALCGSDGRPLQVVMHATSTGNLTQWSRHPTHTFGSTAGFETADWRDPFVFRESDDQLWRMLVAARHDHGPVRRRGLIAQLTSPDLINWTPTKPLWDPGRYLAHECPDVFQWGDWWYLVYSEFSDAFLTRYRMSRDLSGPWLTPERDSIDGRAFYAAKTVGDQQRRFFCGWIATREGETDDGAYQWAGSLSVLEAHQQPNGELSFGLVRELAESFGVRQRSALSSDQQLSDPDGFTVVMDDQPVPDSCRVVARFTWQQPPTECGLVLRGSADGDEGYLLRLEPRRNRIVLDRWPRLRTGSEQWQISGDVPYAIELERPCPLDAGEHKLELIMDGSILVAVVDDQVALSSRLYDHPAGRLGAFVGEGVVDLSEIAVSTR